MLEPDCLAPQAQDFGVVVLHALVGGEVVVVEAARMPGDLLAVMRARAAATHQYTPFGFSLQHHPAHGL